MQTIAFCLKMLLINFILMAWGEPQKYTTDQEAQAKDSAPVQQCSCPAPLSMSWLRFAIPIYVYICLTVVYMAVRNGLCSYS